MLKLNSKFQGEWGSSTIGVNFFVIVGAHGEREHNGGLGRSPQEGPGAEPLVRESGAKPPEAEKKLALQKCN